MSYNYIVQTTFYIFRKKKKWRWQLRIPQWIWCWIANELHKYAHWLHEVRSNLIDFHGAQVGQLPSQINSRQNCRVAEMHIHLVHYDQVSWDRLGFSPDELLVDPLAEIAIYLGFLRRRRHCIDISVYSNNEWSSETTRCGYIATQPCTATGFLHLRFCRCSHRSDQEVELWCPEIWHWLCIWSG